MKVRLSKRAARDLVEKADYVTRLNPDAARSIAAAIADAQRLISEHPRIGRLQKGRDLRKFVVRRYRYLI